MAISTLLMLIFLPFVLSAFTENVCFPGPVEDVSCIQKASNGKFCYYPTYPGTDVSCTQYPQFSSVMAAHLAQGHSIAYYGPDNVFIGDASWPYPPDAGIIYLCGSGTINGAYLSFCSRPIGDNVIDSGEYCIVGLPMKHVDDGCYDPSLAIVNASATPSLVNGITQAPSATAHGPVTTVTVTAQSSSRKASSPGTILIIGILIFVYHAALV
ncbi:hypothetical protein BD410DRAFT_844740 [Rickenella mellea]|uniref:Uncharacterized protein n=1 Tax=Rickenella mellea TaxID=50990 RepID=A0A4Y7PLZ8_9AGAM|nr:hypothetical protein BD410DRAFT_844740 [Rickenella mellea]